jgi:TonB-linked SusC/RagA family outer membrane protein
MDPKAPHLRPNKGILLLTWLLLAVAGSAYAQQIFQGTVSGREGIPLSGATVIIKDANTSTLTDNNGHFSIGAVPGRILTVSFVGYRDREVALGNETELKISLIESIVNMDEVVAVGYGTSRRIDITGAVDRVARKDFNTGVVSNPMQQLQGKVPGLLIVQPGSDPNGDFVVRLRGATSLEGQPPLVVIDGVAIDDFHKALATLNPSDVESYDILKDAAAAAIYGTRGANGVILITTKRARPGKAFVEYSGFTGLEQVARRMDLLNAAEWRKATVNMNAASLDAGGNTDWQKAFTRDAFTQSHTVSVSGGSDHFSVHGSMGYLKQDGIIQNNGKEVITGRLTADQKIYNDRLEVRYNMNISLINRDFLVGQNSTSQSRLGGHPISGYAPSLLPVWPVYDSTGNYFIPPSSNFNPVWLVNEIYSKQKENFFQGSVKADYGITKEFKLGFLGSLSRGNEVYDQFGPVWAGSPNSLAQATKADNNKQNFTGDIHGSYQKTFGKNRLELTGVYEYNKFLNDGFSVTARGFQVPELLTNNLQAATNVQINDLYSYKNEVKLISFLARVVYNFDDRYMLTANIRRDGSSKFGPNNRWGNFPSVALAWRVNNEKFLQSMHWLDNLKLRVSYGLTGNQENLAPYPYQQLYSTSGPYLSGSQINQGYAIIQEYNPDLKWEVRKSFNVGLDFSVWGNRLHGTVDVFNDHTNDMLYQYNIPQPPFHYPTVVANAASAVNKGLEISLGSSIVKKNHFIWDIQANLATLKNHVTRLLGEFKGANLTISNYWFGYAGGGGFGYAPVTKLQIGYPAGVFWLPQHAGLDADGHELYNRYDGNGKLTGTSTTFTDTDRVYIDPTPKFTWGITNSFRFGNFDLGFLLRGVVGQKAFANMLLNFENINYLPGRNVTHKALTNGFADLPQTSTYWLQDASFTRLDNITLGYQLKTMKGIRSLRFYITATNLFVITSYEGNDPEVSTDGSQRYIDGSQYPRTRGFTLGVNAGF